MTNHPKAALAYTVLGLEGFDALFPLLREHDLYAVDRRWEAPDHVDLPSADRPVLRFLLYLAEHANDSIDPTLNTRDHVRAERERIEFFVCADLSDLGRSRAEQVAVVSTLLGYGLSVVAGADVLDGKWYREQVRVLGGWKVISANLDALTQPFSTEAAEGHVRAYAAWAAANPWVLTAGNPHEQFFMPTSWRLTYAATVARARQLHTLGLVSDRIADYLTLEGYVDRHGARTWYWTKVDHLLRKDNAAAEPGDTSTPDVA